MFNLKNILKFKTSIIVSGSTGFIGFNFVEYVLKNSKIKVFAYREKQVLASNNFRLKYYFRHIAVAVIDLLY